MQPEFRNFRLRLERMIYWCPRKLALTMVARARTACFILLCSPFVFCPASPAFERDVMIVPREKPKAAADGPRADLRVDVPLVLIPVNVTTPLGAPVTGLSKENFRLFEDGVEQRITHFSSEDAPVSIGLLLDASGSMRNKMKKSLEAAGELFKNANLDDEFFLIEFNERPKLTVPFTRDANDLYKRLVRAKPMGRTSLLDALHLAIAQMRSARNMRKAIVLLSDGGDNHSRRTETEIKKAVHEADVQIYALGIFDPDDSPKRTIEERNGPHLLDDLAFETGGRHLPVGKLNDLPAACARIGAELHNQYVLGYYPANAAGDGKYRKILVTPVAPPNMPPLKAHFRPGYIAPAE
jgi:Ca-activated chloride channel homolog